MSWEFVGGFPFFAMHGNLSLIAKTCGLNRTCTVVKPDLLCKAERENALQSLAQQYNLKKAVSKHEDVFYICALHSFGI